MRRWLHGVLFFLLLHGPIEAGRHFDITWITAFLIRIPNYLTPRPNNPPQHTNPDLDGPAPLFLLNPQHFTGAAPRGLNQIPGRLSFPGRVHFTHLQYVAYGAANYVFAENEESAQHHHHLLETILRYAGLHNLNGSADWSYDIYNYIQMALICSTYHLRRLSSLQLGENWDNAMPYLRISFLEPFCLGDFAASFTELDWRILQVDNPPAHIQALYERFSEAERLCRQYLPSRLK